MEEPCIPGLVLTNRESKSGVSHGEELNKTEVWQPTPNRGRKQQRAFWLRKHSGLGESSSGEVLVT